MNQNYKLTIILGLVMLTGFLSCTKNSEWIPQESKREQNKKTSFPETKPVEDSYRDGTLPSLYQLNYNSDKIPKPKPEPDPDPWKDTHR